MNSITKTKGNQNELVLALELITNLDVRIFSPLCSYSKRLQEFPLLDAARHILLQGSLKMKKEGQFNKYQTVHVYLFNDLMVCRILSDNPL